MSTQDFLYLSLGIGFIVLVMAVSFVSYTLAVTLKSLKRVLDTAGNIGADVEAVKNQLKSGVLSALLTGLSMFMKKNKGR